MGGAYLIINTKAIVIPAKIQLLPADICIFTDRQALMVSGDYFSCWRASRECLNKGTTNATRTADHDNIHIHILAYLPQQCANLAG